MHMSLSTRLRDRERELGRPVRIGLAGAGQMGMGFVAQVKRIPGMETAAIADVLPGRPQAAFAQAGVNGVVEGDDPDKLAQAVADGRPVGLNDARMLVGLPSARATSRSRSRSCSTTSPTSASRSSAPARVRTTRCSPMPPPTRWPTRPRPST
jgi:threonine dehydrogenase-like Zn-dependent dehydrogenase